MLLVRRFPHGHVLSLGRHQAHCGALYSSNEFAPEVYTTGRAKEKYQELLWTVTPLEQRAQRLCESIEVVRMGYWLPSLPALSVGLHLSNEQYPIVQVLYVSPFEKVGLELSHECAT
jgi:hypothetical protein